MISVALPRVLQTLRERREFRLSAPLRALAALYLVEYLARMTELGVRIRRGRRWAVPGPERLTIVVPTYGRPANLRPIVGAALCLDFLDRIVVVNGNPRVRVADWLPRDGERVIGIDDPGSGVGVRFSVALDHPSEYYFTFDDDMLLRPDQMTRLFRALVKEPEVTHGIVGARYTRSLESPFAFGIRGRETDVDLLTGFHAFTRAHLQRYHGHLRALDLPPSRDIHNGEDILMSAACAGRPRVHRIGRWIQCPSTVDPRIAIHLRRPSFQAERLDLFLRLRDGRAVRAG